MDERMATMQHELDRQGDTGDKVASRVATLEQQLVETVAAIGDTQQAIVSLAATVAEHDRQVEVMSKAIAQWPELFKQFRAVSQAIRKNFDVMASRYTEQLKRLQELQTQLSASLRKVAA